MQIFITSKGKNKLSEMEEKFGRCDNFVIYNTETDEYKCLENINLDKKHGVGVNTVKDILKNNVDVLITGKIGEKSSEIIKMTNIPVFKGKGRYICEEIEDFLNGNLKEINLK